MRYVRIFFLHFQEAFDNRGRSFVWFLIPFVNISALLLFWVGAFHQQGNFIQGWSLSSVSSYYFLLLIVSSLLMVHIEEDVARMDVQQGGLTKYLVKPFSYFWFKFFQEVPWRITQGFFGIIILIGASFILGNFIKFNHSLEGIILSFFIAILGFFLSYIFKMIIGISALWITDYSGFAQLVEIVILIFAGFIMPLEFYPLWLKSVAYVLPFSYMIYFPIVAFTGQLATVELFRVIIVQTMWIAILAIAYKFLWKNGVKKFTAFGQ